MVYLKKIIIKILDTYSRLTFLSEWKLKKGMSITGSG